VTNNLNHMLTSVNKLLLLHASLNLHKFNGPRRAVGIVSVCVCVSGK